MERVKRTKHIAAFRILVCVSGATLLCVLIACSKAPDVGDDIQQFTNGVENLLDLPINVSKVDYSSLAYPRRRDSFIERPESRIGMMDFLRLADCRLNILIARHNNTLNRFQDHVERLFYDLAFVELAAECIENSTQPENTLYQKLASARLEKQQALQISLWNAVFSSSEMSEFFSVYTPLPQRQTILAPSEVKNALSFIITFARKVESGTIGQGTDFDKWRAEFDRALGALERKKYAGALLLAASSSLAHLAAINEVLEHADSFCTDAPSAYFVDEREAVKRLAAVFSNDIDPLMRHIIASMDEVMKLQEIFQHTDLYDREFVQGYWQPYWGKEPGSLYHTLASTVETQRAHWRRLLAQCQSPH